jgi:hypothetical protein
MSKQQGILESCLKPPVGVIPEQLWLDKRKHALCSAIHRYNEAGVVAPLEWIAELKRLIEVK